MFIMLMNIAMMLADCVLLPRRLQNSNILMMNYKEQRFVMKNDFLINKAIFAKELD